MENQASEKQMYGWPKAAPQDYSNTQMFAPRGLGVGLGNINSQDMIMANEQRNIMSQMSNGGGEIQRHRAPQQQAIVPMLPRDQSFGYSAGINTSPDRVPQGQWSNESNLEYLRYGGSIAGRAGDVTASIGGYKEQVNGDPYTSTTRNATIQYTPEQIKGLMLQASAENYKNNYGSDSNTTSAGLGYVGKNWGADITGTKFTDNGRTIDNRVDANINYRW